MNESRVVSRGEWLDARRALLAREKAFNQARDALSAERRALPWVEIDKDYTFTSTDGHVTLADLFEGRSQLIVYHFMFDPSWEVGCKSCSFVTDHFQGAPAHLAARDVTLVSVSRAPLEKLTSFKERMGWSHRWVSSHDSDFNFDFGVSFTPEQIEAKACDYNYSVGPSFGAEAPGLSVFVRKGDRIFHTYSTYSRGLDIFINAYNLLDHVPAGRDEAELDYGMAWVRLHDAY